MSFDSSVSAVAESIAEDSEGLGASALIVAFHAADLLEKCLRTFQGVLPVLIVDNSSDVSVAEVASRFGAEYLDSGANLGFARAVNLGVDALPSTHDVLLLNPDAEVSPAAVIGLLELIRSAGRPTAAVAPRQLGDDDEEQRVHWPWPSPSGAWLEALGLGARRRGRPGFLIGSVLLLGRPALEVVGSFDSRFFLYAEETDWQRRAVAAGFELQLADDIHAKHVGAGTSSNATVRELLFHAGQETYIRKWFGARGWAAYRLAVIAGACLRLLVPRTARTASTRLQIYAVGPRRAARRKGLL